MRQESMLFPSGFAPLMTASWKPKIPYPYEEMRLRSARGLLYGVLWHAPHARGTVLYSHGNGEDLEVSQRFVAQFIERGYNVLIWDYRGYGLSTGELGGQAGLLADAESVYQWLSTRRDAGNIVFYGRSLGTGFAVYLASRHPGHQVLLEAAYDSLASVAQDHYPMFPATLILRYPMPSVEWVKTIPTRIYMIHGARDQLIPPSHPLALAQAASNASLVMIRGVGHNGLSYTARYADWLTDALRSMVPGTQRQQ
ncbi:alpha/beta hydrolase family protein [mine drainage metagenome]|uniref:Alpha/beta hydrolase family protein n=1 Tax=mine drainage metagenome TaxID=410659 RepID=A0A1J5R055_9ZZZZ